MSSVWSFVAKSKNRQVLSWIGGGLVALAAGAWAMVNYVWPAHEAAKTVCAQQGSVAGGRDASGNTITYTGGSAPATVSCSDTVNK